MTGPKTDETRVAMFRNTGQDGRGLGPGRRGHPARPRRRGQHDPAGPGRLRRPGQRGGGQRPVGPRRAGQARSPWPTSSRIAWTARTRPSSKQFGDQVDVPPERQFLGFDAYRKAIDCLRPGDVAMLHHPRRLPPHAPRIRGGEGRATCSWRRPSPPIRAACSRSSGPARRPRRRTSRSPPA